QNHKVGIFREAFWGKMCYAISREGLNQSARADSERFFSRQKNGKQRNTLCISCFSFCMDGKKDPLLGRRRLIQPLPPKKEEWIWRFYTRIQGFRPFSCTPGSCWKRI